MAPGSCTGSALCSQNWFSSHDGRLGHKAVHVDASVCVRCPHVACHPEGARGQQHLSSNGHTSCPPLSTGRDIVWLGPGLEQGKRVGSQLKGVSAGHTGTV